MTALETKYDAERGNPLKISYDLNLAIRYDVNLELNTGELDARDPHVQFEGRGGGNPVFPPPITNLWVLGS